MENLNQAPAKARNIDPAEVAKLIRPLLKKTFPGTKFSVRTDRYAGGASIDVSYTDGPTPESVQKLLNGFAGSRFDGMDDLKYGADSWFCVEHGARAAATWGSGDDRSGPVESRCCAAAELVHFGSNYVTEHRTLSPEFSEELRQKIVAQAGLPADTSPNAALPPNSIYAQYPFDAVRDGVYRLSRVTAR